MRLRVNHTTSYRYDAPAGSIIQVLRLEPTSHEGQYVAAWNIDLSIDAQLHRRDDAFGNITHVFSSDAPLDTLTISVEGQIETQDTGGVMRGTFERFPPSLFLRSTDLTECDDALGRFTGDIRAATKDNALDFLHALMSELHGVMTFDDDPTHSGTTAAEAFKLKRGVCQDYAHIFLSCARHAGIPARYVSGHFLRADGVAHQDAGHAWAEAFVPSLGWVAFDAANKLCATDAHIRVATGLDYLGACPVRGSRIGGGAEHLSVSVKVDQAGRQSQN